VTAEPSPVVRALHVAAALLFMTAAFILTKTGRDALYFQGRGLYDLPKAYLGIAVLSVPAALLTLDLMRRLGPRHARVLVPLAVSTLLAAFHPMLRPGAGLAMTGFFIFVPLSFGVLFSIAWLLAADLLEGAPRAALARAYSLVGASSILGGLGGGLVARALAFRVEPGTLVLMGAFALALSAALLAWTQARFPPGADFSASSPTTPKPPRLSTILRDRYLLLLLGVGMTGSVVGVLVDFQIYLAAATSGNSARENARFFANVYLLLNAAALAVQLYLMPRLQRAVGIHGSLLILPGALLGAATGLLAGATLAARTLVRVTDGGLRASIHRVNWEQAYLPLDRAHRATAKVWIDGAAARVAEGLAAVVLYLWLAFVVAGRPLVGQPTGWMTYLLLGALVLWVALTRTLVSRLKPWASAIPESELRIAVPVPDA
jgi:hypothetical protein